MSVNTSTAYFSSAGDGVTTTFGFAAPVQAAADVAVQLVDTASGVPTAQTLGVDYTVSIAADGQSASVVMMVAPPVGKSLVRRRNADYLQPYHLPANGPFPNDLVEAGMDRLVEQLQAIRDTVSRGIRLGDSDAPTLAALPPLASILGKYLFINVTGQVAGVDGPAGVAISGAMTPVVQGASLDLARAAFAVPHEAHGADIASGATIDLGAAAGDLVDVTGVAAITAITLPEGVERTVRFTGALTLTNGASLVLPGGANITTAAGDYAVFRGYAAGVVRCVGYQRADGGPLKGVLQIVTFETGAMATGTTPIPRDDTIPTSTEGDQYMSLSITPKRADSTLIVEALFNYEFSAVNVVVAALFRDAGAAAIDASANWHAGGATENQIKLGKSIASGSTAATTFKLRAGGVGAGTVTFNGVSGVREFGGVYLSSLKIIEVA